MRLFKYVSRKGIEILRTGTIQFGKASNLNDPFECAPGLNKVDLGKMRGYFAKEWAFIRHMQQRSTPAERLPSGVAIQSVEKIATEYLLGERDVELENEILKLNESDQSRLAILSLSGTAPDTADAILMWGHYGEMHRGFCIEFNAKHEWFDAFGGQMLPVSYAKDDQRHPLRFIEHEGIRDVPQIPMSSYFSKGKSWSYENEHRIVCYVTDPRLDRNLKKGDKVSMCRATLPLNSIVSITFGARTTKWLMKAVALLLKRSGASHVQLFKSTMDVHEYRMKRIPYICST